MRIDSHQHYWNSERCDYHWMGPDIPAVLQRAYGPTDLVPSLEKHSMDKSVIVQAADNSAETDYMLEIARESSSVAGVVGWLDIDSLSFAKQFERYCKDPYFLGIRPMLQDRVEEGYILRPQILDSLRLIAERDFPFDILVYAEQRPDAIRMLERVPGLRAVVDHLAKPVIRDQEMQPWKREIEEMASFPNVYCKLSGMITEANHSTWTPETLQPYVDHVVQCFGLERVMFGSDWPVCLLAGSYDQVVEALLQTLSPYLDATTEQAVFGGNAQRFYKIDCQEKNDE